jgi:hypothetical protein
MTVEFFSGSSAISAPTLPKERELSLAHAQRCNFLIIKQSCRPLSVENIPGEHCDFSTYLTKRASSKFGACAEGNFLIMEQCCGPLAVEMIPGKHCNFSNNLDKSSRAQSGA